MKRSAWFLLMTVASISGCAANQFHPSAPMHVPTAFYKPIFYSVGQGLNAPTLAHGDARRHVRLMQILAAVKMPIVPSTGKAHGKQREKALSLYGLGLNAMYRGQYAGARYLLSQSRKLDPHGIKILMALGQVSSRMGDTADADRYFSLALRLDPQNPLLQVHAAQFARGDNAAVLRHLLIARQSPQLKADSPWLPRIDLLLGAALQANGYYRAAETAYRQVATLLHTPAVTYQFNRQDRRLLHSRGLIEFLIGRNALLAGHPQDAIIAFTVAHKKGFTNPVILGQLALAEQFTGHPHAAARDAVSYCVHTHGGRPSITLLTNLELNQNGSADILTAVRSYKSGSIDAHTALAAAGKAAWNVGHLNAARRIYAQLITQPAPHADLVQQYIVLAISTGHREQAIKLVTRQLAKGHILPSLSGTIAADFSGSHPAPSEVRRLLQDVQSGRLISTGLSAQHQVEQLDWQYALVDDAALLSGHRQFALAVTTQTLHQATQFWPTLKAQCLALALAHHFKQADALVRTALAERLGGPAASVTQAQVFAAADRLAAALTAAANGIDRHPHYRALWREAEHLADQQENFPREIALLHREEELFPQSRRLAFRLVQAEYAFGDIPAFRRQAQKFLARFPLGKRHLIVAAIVDSLNHNWVAVQRESAIAHRAYPTSKLAAVWFASLGNSMGHARTSVHILRTALRYHPANALLLNQYAELCDQTGAAGTAYLYARQIAARYPQSASIREAYLEVLLHNHLWMQAHQLVARWLSTSPHSLHALQALWRIDFRSRHYAAALTVARQLVDRPIPRFEDLSRLANSYWQLHRRSAALAVYRRILAIAPQNAYANNNLGFEMVQQKIHLRQALAHIALAVHNYPNTAQYLDSYGWGLYKLGFAARAIPYLQRAAVLAGFRHPTVYRHLGNALAKIGDWHGALLVWQAGVKAIYARPPLTKRQRRLLKRLEHRIKSEKIRESLRHLKNAQAM